VTSAPATFAAVFRAELLRNGRRPAPYVMAALFIGNALLWGLAGPAAARGWSTNGEFYIARLLTGFSFMTLPFCTAVLMGDSVLRDFTDRVDPLIFSKPLKRAAYLLAKFSGSFAVLVLCQFAFAVALAALQLYNPPGLVTGAPKLLPYAKHFLFFVVVSHLALAALHFTIGTLTRSMKLVYGLAVCFYPLYVAYQLQLKSLPPGWRIALDPLLMNWSGEVSRDRSAASLNALVVQYDAGMIGNRLVMLGIAVGCLALLCVRFNPVREAAAPARVFRVRGLGVARAQRDTSILSPAFGARFDPLLASIGIELRQLRDERSLIAIVPMAVATTILAPLVYGVRATGAAPSAAFAHTTATTLLLVLIGVVVFYVGETMHRDRERRVEALIWATPVSDWSLLLSKFAAAVTLAGVLVVLTALASGAVQAWRGDSPIDVGPYMRAYLVILLPTAIFATAAAMALNVLLRDKYSAYVVSVGIVGLLFYLYGQGHDHWSYNPALFGRWTPSDLTAGGTRWLGIVAHRLYVVALAAVFLGIAAARFQRPSGRRR
jgi:ABC-type transport system involved in multi-copper enzyme maturation permease subunit